MNKNDYIARQIIIFKKLVEMVKKCFTCKIKYGSFAYDKKSEHHYCAEHKLEGMTNIKKPKCTICGNYAHFALNGTKKPIYCKQHKIEGTHNVSTKKCIKCFVNTAVYNTPSETSAEYCLECKDDNMEIKKPRCVACYDKNPIFGFSTEKYAQYCVDCKTDEMVRLNNKYCIICNENKSRYGLEIDTIAYYCSNCKTDEMVIKHNRACIGCKKVTAFFAYPNDKKPKYCAKCKVVGMVDIIGNKCIVCNKKTPNYGNIGSKRASNCKDCKEPQMEDIRNKRCITCNHKRPLYNYETETKPLYCRECSLPNMVDIKNPKCKNEWCKTFTSNKQYEGYCAYCYRHMYPDKPMALNYKNKEASVVQYIKQEFPDIDIIVDKRVQDGCSKRRPDILIDLGYQIVIIEVDENQHIDYDCSCENKRLMQLSQDVGHRPIVFIRFNPDDYNTTDKKITSCWAINSSGICCVKRSKQKEWINRLESLKNTVSYWLDNTNRTDKTIEVVQLFYDEDD